MEYVQVFFTVLLDTNTEADVVSVMYLRGVPGVGWTPVDTEDVILDELTAQLTTTLDTTFPDNITPV